MNKCILLSILLFNNLLYSSEFEEFQTFEDNKITINSQKDFDEFGEFEANKISLEENHTVDILDLYNKNMMEFNYIFYDKLLIPTIEVYEKYTPDESQILIDNFFDNLNKPISIINNMIQFDITGTIKETSIFLLNTTLGLFGLFDIADNVFDIKDTKQTSIKTANKYDIPQGEYFVLPIIGPTTVRDSILLSLESQINYSLDYTQRNNLLLIQNIISNRNDIKYIRILEGVENKNEYIKNIYIKRTKK